MVVSNSLHRSVMLNSAGVMARFGMDRPTFINVVAILDAYYVYVNVRYLKVHADDKSNLISNPFGIGTIRCCRALIDGLPTPRPYPLDNTSA